MRLKPLALTSGYVSAKALATPERAFARWGIAGMKY
jgi:hypothetical protein